MSLGSKPSYRRFTSVPIVLLAGGLILAGVGRAHAARDGISPDKACSNGTACLSVQQLSTGEGIVSKSTVGNAVESHSDSGNGVFGQTKNPSMTTKHCASGLIGLDQSLDGGTMNYGVSGRSWHGTGVLGLASTGIGLTGDSTVGTGILGISASRVNPALKLQATGTGPLMLAENASKANVLQLDQHGNLTIAGVIKTSGSCSEGCVSTHGGPGVHLISYAPRESSPTMEDFGESHLVNGVAYVRIDPAFANAIDERKGYLVFVTPDGETKGLFVAARTPTGFQVRESGGGHATIDFSYRIVAKPFDSDDPRLPLVQDPAGR